MEFSCEASWFGYFAPSVLSDYNVALFRAPPIMLYYSECRPRIIRQSCFIRDSIVEEAVKARSQLIEQNH